MADPLELMRSVHDRGRIELDAVLPHRSTKRVRGEEWNRSRHLVPTDTVATFGTWHVAAVRAFDGLTDLKKAVLKTRRNYRGVTQITALPDADPGESVEGACLSASAATPASSSSSSSSSASASVSASVSAPGLGSAPSATASWTEPSPAQLRAGESTAHSPLQSPAEPIARPPLPFISARSLFEILHSPLPPDAPDMSPLSLSPRSSASLASQTAQPHSAAEAASPLPAGASQLAANLDSLVNRLYSDLAVVTPHIHPEVRMAVWKRNRKAVIKSAMSAFVAWVKSFKSGYRKLSALRTACLDSHRQIARVQPLKAIPADATPNISLSAIVCSTITRTVTSRIMHVIDRRNTIRRAARKSTGQKGGRKKQRRRDASPDEADEEGNGPLARADGLDGEDGEGKEGKEERKEEDRSAEAESRAAQAPERGADFVVDPAGAAAKSTIDANRDLRQSLASSDIDRDTHMHILDFLQRNGYILALDDAKPTDGDRDDRKRGDRKDDRKGDRKGKSYNKNHNAGGQSNRSGGEGKKCGRAPSGGGGDVGTPDETDGDDDANGSGTARDSRGNVIRRVLSHEQSARRQRYHSPESPRRRNTRKPDPGKGAGPFV